MPDPPPSKSVTEKVPTTRVNYSAKYELGGGIKYTGKNATVPYNKKETIVENVKEWSENKYDAHHAKNLPNFVQVVNIQAAPSRGKALEEVEEMQRIVHRHTK